MAEPIITADAFDEADVCLERSLGVLDLLYIAASDGMLGNLQRHTLATSLDTAIAQIRTARKLFASTVASPSKAEGQS